MQIQIFNYKHKFSTAMQNILIFLAASSCSFKREVNQLSFPQLQIQFCTPSQLQTYFFVCKFPCLFCTNCFVAVAVVVVVVNGARLVKNGLVVNLPKNEA